MKPVVGIVMGSASDWDTMKSAAKVLEEFGIAYEAKAMSAHRTPAAVMAWTGAAKGNGMKVIIADTKFEFGLNEKGEVVLIDEILTADSSRFWPADQYRVGISPPSYDKQFVRDYLETLDWDKTPPAPKLPAEVIAKTSAKYREALEKIAGKKIG